MKPIGILALQGGFNAHERTLKCCAVATQLVKTTEDLSAISAIVLPGGESSTMLSLLKKHGLYDALAKFTQTFPVFATCAGVILLQNLRSLAITLERNAYGAQLASGIFPLMVNDTRLPETFRGMFIRAPKILSINDPNIRILATYQNDPVLIEKNNILAATFHPELTQDQLIHRLFIEMIHK